MLTIIKIGGGSGIDPTAALDDIVTCIAQGDQVVVVHGCSAATDQLATDLNVPPRYVTSTAGVRSRHTDAQALAIFIMAARRVNSEIVRELQCRGVNALGLSGLDGGLLRGTRKDMLRVVAADGRQRIIRDDYTGRVEHVNINLLTLLLENGYVPVIAPLALADTGDAVNVDGDRAAAMVASSLAADALIILTNVPGLLADATDERTLVTSLSRAQIGEYETRISGGMRRKLIGAREALQGGVSRVVLADGRAAHPLQAALAGRGTVIA